MKNSLQVGRLKVLFILIAIVIICGVFIAGLYAGKARIFNSLNNTECVNLSKYVKQSIHCGAKYSIRKHGYLTLKASIEEYIQVRKNENKITNVSVYFSDLENGPTMGINEYSKFTPASLLKLPLVLTYLSNAEEDANLLQKKIVREGKLVSYQQTLSSESTVVAGQEYSIEELLYKTIVYSDNNSYSILYENLVKENEGREKFIQTYRDLGLILPESNLEETINVKTYSSIFRELYNATYLSIEMSEKALSILSEADYKNGLRKKLPKHISVAHKYGERSGFKDTNIKQLHDCGIVYYPGNPYLVCIMTRGYEFVDMEETIATISEMIYKEVDTRKL